MKNHILLFPLFFLLTFLFTSCDSKDTPVPDPVEVNTVSQFIYDGMSTLYYWADEVVSKKPAITDDNPEDYFYKILNSTDTQHGWSWITDDVEGLLAGFEGVSLSFGYDLGFAMIDDIVYAYVRYVHKDTPADNAGIERLHLIGKLNGQHIQTEERNGIPYISSNDVNLLYGNNMVKFTLYRLIDNDIVEEKEVTITPDNSAKDPVLYDNIYTINNQKIGYLFYTDFFDNYNPRLFEVFSNFKQAGVTDLVLDLRYNGGGAVTAATYLASLIAPRSLVESKSPFVVMDFNNLLNTTFDKSYNEASAGEKYKYDRKNYLGDYDSAIEQNPLGANLDLNRVYIIATGNSYSASELITFCLDSYMDVVHIGSNTGGKYTGSWTIHAYDPFIDDNGNTRARALYKESSLSSSEKNSLKNWAIQPIVAIYSNKDNENFLNPGHLAPDYSLNEGFGYINYWAPLGDTKDVLLGQALYLITGDESYKPQQPSSVRSISDLERELSSPLHQSNPLIIDNPKLTPEDFQKLRGLHD